MSLLATASPESGEIDPAFVQKVLHFNWKMETNNNLTCMVVTNPDGSKVRDFRYTTLDLLRAILDSNAISDILILDMWRHSQEHEALVTRGEEDGIPVIYLHDKKKN